MGKLLNILIVLLLTLSTALAAESFVATSTAVKDSIFSDEVGEYTLTIKNLDSIADRYSVFSIDPQWTVVTKSVIAVEGGDSIMVDLIVDPSNTITEGQKYGVPVVVRSIADDESVTLSLPIIVNSDQYRTYQPSIFTDISLSNQGKIDPSEPVDLSVRLVNKNRRDLPEITVSIQSEFFNQRFITSLSPIGTDQDQVTKILTFQLDPLTPPQNFTVDVKLQVDNRTIGSVKTLEAKIIESPTSFSRNVITDVEKFLYNEYRVELANNANIESTETVRLKSSWWQKQFTHSNMEPSYEESEGEFYAVFNVTLTPGESIEIQSIQNYRPFAITTTILLLLIVVIVVLYYTLRSPLVIQKRVEILKGTDQGVSKLKVILDIKNRTNKTLQNVKIIERTPNITQVDKNFIVGTLKPSKIITHQSKGTLLRWDFITLDAYEERIITYNISSKLSILGDLNLPATVVKFDNNGKTQTVTEDESKLSDKEEL